MTAISYQTPPDAQVLPFKDRRVSMKVVGVLLILLGAFSGCLSVLAPVGMVVAVMFQPPAAATPGATTAPVALTQRPELDLRTMAFALSVYILATVLFVWSGIGALKLRRWVRPVMLVIGWTWLVSGIAGLVYWLVGTPSMREVMAAATPPGSPQPPAAVYQAMAWGTGTMMTLFLVVLPAVVVWVFGRAGVRQTLDLFDPQTRWTDACPTPALAVSAWLAMAALACVMYCAYAVLPIFGFVITGLPAIAGLLLVAAVFAAVAWQAYRLRPSGWWGALVLYTLWAASMIWTFSHIGWYEFYVKAGYTPQQVDQLLRFSGPYESGSLWMMALWAVMLVGYLIWVRRYFFPTAPVAPAPTAGQPAGG
jgi:hypothetical protein